MIAASAFDLLRPEAALAVGLCAVLVGDCLGHSGARRLAPWLGVLAALASVWLAVHAPATATTMLAVDAITDLARAAIAATTALVLVASAGERGDAGDLGAWTASVLAVGLGAMLAAAAANFVVLWLGLEMTGLASYTLAAFRAGDRRSAEAGMKFVLFGGASSAAMLFGISHVYGLTGHLDFAGIGAALAGAPLAVFAALGLAAVGIATKLTLVPFHFYAPDVYQGAPALAVAAVSAAPKMAAAAALVHGLQLAVPEPALATSTLATALAAIAAVSALVAAATAVVQRDAKRIVAFSGVGHASAVVLAIACAPGSEAVAAAAFYLLTYAIGNVGALVCLSVLERERGSCALPSLAGARQQRPVLTALLCLFLLSLAGVPPLAGFLGKWSVLQVLLARATGSGGQVVLGIAALTLLLATVVAIWSYLLIVRAVLFADGEAVPQRAAPLPRATALVLAACASGTVLLGFWLQGLSALRHAL